MCRLVVLLVLFRNMISFSCCEKSFFILTPALGMLRAHSFPDIATSSAFFKNGSLSNILEAPSYWSNAVFASFPLRNVHYIFEGVPLFRPWLQQANV